ncbi:MAG: hypothetical protein KUG83_02645 [Gammaproteobacteria bacterium]|nr:hypothetical protein [Gammaproteobacteria bacterium]
MNQNVDKSRLLLSLVIFSGLLSACGSDKYSVEDCSVRNATPDTIGCGAKNNIGAFARSLSLEYVEKDGVTGRVLGMEYWAEATVCFDHNRNGACDETEPSERSYQGGQYSFDAASIEASIISGAPLLAVTTNRSGGSVVLYAPAPTHSSAKGINVTVFTTVVVNEMEFNPYTLYSFEQSRHALQNSDFVIGNNSVLLGRDYIAEGSDSVLAQAADIADSFFHAQRIKTGQHYKAVAAAIDAMYQAQTYRVTINQALVDLQTIHEQGGDATLSNPALEWGLGHDEEVSTNLHTQGNYAVVGSQYHNRLVVLELADDASLELLSYNDFAASPDVERDQIDAFTGASEQLLESVYVTADQQSILVGVEKKKKSALDLGVGLYRADFSDPHSIPMKRFAEDTGSTNFHFFPGLNDVAISSEGGRVALAGEDKKVTVLNTTDFGTIQEFSFASRVRSVGLNSDGSVAFAGLFGTRIGLAILDVATGNELGFSSVNGRDYPENIRVSNNHSNVIWNLRDDNVLSFYNLSDLSSGPLLIGQIPAEQRIKSYDISPDERLAIIASSGGEVALYSLGRLGKDGGSIPERLLKTFTMKNNAPINTVVFASDTRALVSIKNGLHTIDIDLAPPASEWNDEQKQNWFSLHRTPANQ